MNMIGSVVLAVSLTLAPAHQAPSWRGCVTHTLARPASLHDLSERTGLTPAILLESVEQCDGLQHGWTRQFARLLDGGYGARIGYAQLPKGTRWWTPGSLP
jgi:hypothetical protein